MLATGRQIHRGGRGGRGSINSRLKPPSLPKNLIQEIGAEDPQIVRRSRPGPTNKRTAQSLSRKERRQADRRQSHRPTASKARHDDGSGSSRPPPSSPDRSNGHRQGQTQTRHPAYEEDSTDSEGDSGSWSGLPDDGSQPNDSIASHAVRERLAQDDAEILQLERKLGLKKRNSLPKAFQEDGLDFILDELDGGQAGRQSGAVKRDAEDEDWLARKRRKASKPEASVVEGPDSMISDGETNDLETPQSGYSDSASSSAFDGLETAFLDDTESEGAGWDSDDVSGAPNSSAPLKKPKENPYAPPTDGRTAAKYVPPSRRQDGGSEEERAWRVRRQAQGLVNRLTEANLLGIVGDIERLYQGNPRQVVTSTVVDLLLVQICDPTALSDTLLVLLAGFSAGMYRVIGTDFGASLVERVVELFRQRYEQALTLSSATSPIPKETSNLVTFLCELYTLQVLGCNIVFDYIRLLLDRLTELNTELLLRIIRTCGPLLRQDDPLALKDVVSLLRQAVIKVGGEQQISVRTKFMIDTINDLKNNRAKAGANTSAVVSEHRMRIKKLLGSLGSRKLSASEPLGIRLDDITSSEKKGRWWLVGAGWEGRPTKAQSDQTGRDSDGIRQRVGSVDGSETSDSGDSAMFGPADGVTPDIAALARENGMNTDVRRAIFAAIVCATDCEDASTRLLRLRLNKDRQREIPTVVMQCAGAEREYNPYYTLIATRLCSDHKIRWAFQDSVWKLFRRLGEPLFGEADGDEDAADGETTGMRRLANIAKMLGSLVASGALSLTMLKCLNLLLLRPKTKMLLEVMLITALLRVPMEGDEATAAVAKMFGTLEKTGPESIRGVQWFLKKVVSKSDLTANEAEARRIRHGCSFAQGVLEGLLEDGEDEPAL